MLAARLLSLLFVFLSACTTVDVIPTDYAAPDAGKVIVGIGATNETRYQSYTLYFRPRVAPAPGQKPSFGMLTYRQEGFLFKAPTDYSSQDEAGVVLIQALPPGDYEVYNFAVFLNAGTIQNTYSSKVDFSIPFTVRPGEATYLGNYQANKVTGKNFFGMTVAAGAAFVVSDRERDDVAIAAGKSKLPLGTIRNVTPDADSVGSPFLRRAGVGGASR